LSRTGLASGALLQHTVGMQLDGDAVLGFVASGCGPCLQQRPVWDALPVDVEIIDVDVQPELRARFGVEGLPTTVVVRGGEVAQVLRGLSTTRQIMELLGVPA
jgi:thioredoxin 1